MSPEATPLVTPSGHHKVLTEKLCDADHNYTCPMSENVATKRWVQGWGYPLLGGVCVVVIATCWGLIRDSSGDLDKHTETSDKIHQAIFKRMDLLLENQLEMYKLARFGMPSPALDQQVLYPQPKPTVP